MKNIYNLLLFSYISLQCFSITNAQQAIQWKSQLEDIKYSEGGCSDCGFTSPDPEFRIRMKDNGTTTWYNQDWTGSEVSCNWATLMGVGFTGGYNWVGGTGWVSTNINNQIQLELNGWEPDPWPCNPDDANCGSYGAMTFNSGSPINSSMYIGENCSPCALSALIEHFRTCNSDGVTGTYYTRWKYQWRYNQAPTITTHPTANSVYCVGTAATPLTVAVANDFYGRTGSAGMMRFIKWQISNNTDCSGAANWQDIPGATSASFTPYQIAGTRLYRALITSNCSADFTTNTAVSNCARVTYNPMNGTTNAPGGFPYGTGDNAPAIQSIACGITVLPGSSHTLSALLPPSAGAAANINTFAWSASGGTLSATTGTSITWTAPSTIGNYTITLDYQDGCPAGNATAACIITVGAPACEAIYVSSTGADGVNCGGPNNPCRTLTATNGALAKVSATRNHIKMTSGAYTENIVELQSNLIIEGSYVESAGIWTKSSSTGASTTITCGANENINSNVEHIMGLRSNDDDNWKLIDLNIKTIDVPTASLNTTSGNGKSNYAIHISNGSTGYEIIRCSITSGNASDGLGRGTTGFRGADGGDGVGGSVGDGASSGGCENGRAGRAGGAGGSAGANATNMGGTTATSGGGGGGGGVGGSSCGGGSNPCSGCDNGGSGGGGGGGAGNSSAGAATLGGGDGNQPGGSAGGNGSAGGIGPGNDDIGNDVLYNNAGAGGTGIGSGGNGGRGRSAGCNNGQTPGGEAGSVGNTGTNGTDATGQTAAVYGTYYTPGFGSNGTAGTGGGGGGGGGGAGCDAYNTDASGSGGSGGGGGGGGGGAGAGGRGGGSSIGIFLAGTTNSGNLLSVNIVSGVAGSGGLGGLGGNGGGAGNGGTTASGVSDGRNGGAGGAGGAGGRGGNGANGTSGISAQVVTNGVASTPSATISNTPVVTVNYNNNKLCRNSVIELTKTANDWNLASFGTGFTLVKEQDNTTTSQTVSSSPVRIFTATASQDADVVTTTPTTFNSYLQIESDTRTIPTLSGLVANYCINSTISPTVTSWGTVVEHKWEVFSGTLAPTYGSTAGLVWSSSSALPTSTAFTTAGDYILRYQQKEECCGWSLPVFYKFKVNPDISNNTIATSSSTICTNTTPVSIDGSEPATLSGGNNSYSYQWQYNTGSGYTNAATTADYDATGVLVTPGTYTVRRIVTSGGCTVTSTETTINVQTPSTNPLSLTAFPSGLCSAGNVTLSISGGSLGNNAYWELYNGNPAGSGSLLQNGNSSNSFTYTAGSTINYYVRYYGGCNGTGSAVSTTVPVGATNNIVLTPDTDLSTTKCDNGSWTYYEDPDVAGKYIFAINWDPQGTNSNAAAKAATTVDIVVKGSGNYWSSSNTTNGWGTWVMDRYWDVNLNGTSIDPANPVHVRFYYDPAKITAMQSAVTSFISTCAAGGVTTYQEPTVWFKTLSGQVDPISNLNTVAIEQGNSVPLTPVAPGSVPTPPTAPTATGTENSVNYVQFNNLTSFSGGTLAMGASPITGTTPLPVELLFFTGHSGDTYNMLNWATASEHNVSHFEVQRSRNGFEFEPIGVVAAVGESTTEQRYQFKDPSPKMGNNYYRLNIIDNDASSENSNIINLPFKPNKPSISALYPNPTESNITYELYAPARSSVVVEIFDAIGKKLAERSVELEEGLNTFKYDCSECASGVYMLQVTFQDGNSETKMFSKH